MRLLDRYLLRELLVPLGYCLAGFLIFWLTFDLFSQLSELQDGKLKLEDIARYYGLKLPEILVLILPMALLLSVLYTLTNHARHNELVAIRAAGVSQMRLSLPYLAVGFLISLGLLALNELWVPQASETAEKILARAASGNTTTAQTPWQPVNFRNAPADRLWTVRGFNRETFAMTNLTVVWPLPDGSSCTIHAGGAAWENGQWVFHQLKKIVRPVQRDQEEASTGTTVVLDRQPMPEFTETPEQILSEIKISRLTSIKARAAKEAQVSIAEILHYLKLNPHPGPDRHGLLFTQLHGRLAAPWTALVVVLIALPFGAMSGRRNVFVGVASSVFICFAYFILMRLGLALGTGGYIAPWLGAWLPNLLFAVTGLGLTLRLR